MARESDWEIVGQQRLGSGDKRREGLGEEGSFLIAILSRC